MSKTDKKSNQPNANYEVIELKGLPASRKFARIKISGDLLKKYYKKKLEELQKTTEIKGFRKGKVPLDLVEKHHNKDSILLSALEEAIKYVHSQFLEQHNLNAIGAPDVKPISYDLEKGAEYEIEFDVLPEFKLPDYKKIAKSLSKPASVPKISDKEVEEQLIQARKEILFRQKATSAKTQEDLIKIQQEVESTPEDELPKLDVENLKVLGEFKDEKDFRAKIKKDLEEMAKIKQEEKMQIELADKLIEQADFEVPQSLVEFELNNLLSQFEYDLANAGISLEEYLKKNNKTLEQLKEELRPQAEKKVKLQLILFEIAKKEDIKPDSKEVTQEINKIMATYPQANPTDIYNFVLTQKTNQKVFEFLKNLK